jgi:myo-inositol-1(or 4)-monophosphatase
MKDIKAVAVGIAREAGGAVTDMRGKDYHLESPLIVASNGRIHEEMVDILNRATI